MTSESPYIPHTSSAGDDPIDTEEKESPQDHPAAASSLQDTESLAHLTQPVQESLEPRGLSWYKRVWMHLMEFKSAIAGLLHKNANLERKVEMNEIAIAQLAEKMEQMETRL